MSHTNSMETLFNICGCGEFLFRTHIKLKGISICLHFLNKNAKGVFSRPFSHLEIETDGDPEFDIYVMHGGPSSEPIDGWKRFERDASEERKLLIFSNDGKHILYNYESKVLSGYDSQNKKAYYYIPNLDILPFYEKAAPMRMIFHHFAQDYGMILVHGAAIAIDGHGILMAGKGGSGKTTTAICAALRGFDYLGDDYVILDTDDKIIYSLYSSCKIRWDSEELLPELASFAVNTRNEDKGYFFMNEINGRIRKSIRLYVVVIPQIGGDESSYLKTGGINALRVLSSSTIFQMPGSGRTTLHNISKAIRNVPAYEMILSSCPEEINKRLTELVKGI
ncbi:MAG: hypothetical protein JXR56_02670 [Candidatus Cloacimonetes bacterium]|nr:hypothetical protein [Candidatus Cloacimonadota bacterium]